MKPNKGFTLIELLAVIVILAIIALITVPVVINIINNTKKGAAEDSVYGFVEALKLNWMTMQSGFESESGAFVLQCTGDDCIYGIINTHYYVTMNINSIISGTKPTSAMLIGNNGNIYAYNLKYGEYICRYENEKAICGNTKKDDLENMTYGIYVNMLNENFYQISNITELEISCNSEQCFMYIDGTLNETSDTSTAFETFSSVIPNSALIRRSPVEGITINLNFEDYTCKIENEKAVCTKN